MLNRKVFFSFLLCIFFFACSQGNKGNRTNVIRLNLENGEYKELVLWIRCQDKPNPDYDMHFDGLRDGNLWTFAYPDTLYDKSLYFSIQEPTYTDTLSRYITFEYVCNKDTLRAAEFFFTNQDTTRINAIYLQTDTSSNILAKDKNGNLFFKTILSDSYSLKTIGDKELLSFMEVQSNDFFRCYVDSARYDTELDKYIELVKKYPDSYSLIAMLDSRLSFFKSKRDVQKIYDCFSQDNKNSFVGKRIHRYLTDNYFKNSILKATDTGESEAIVIDSTKYNLIIFSASWCPSCIEEIPILKKIYEDLSDKLDMTYVSIDESKTVDAWRQLMKKENIPWRSVLAVDDIDNIKEKYFVQGVPYCLFVHPGGFMEPINVRNTTESTYLYKTIRK